jgi:hypothetical protein
VRIAAAVVGVILLLLGLANLPRVIGRIGQEEDNFVAGRITVIAIEMFGGAGLVYFGLRPRKRTENGSKIDRTPN